MKISSSAFSQLESAWREVHRPMMVEYIAATAKCTGRTTNKDVEQCVLKLNAIWHRDMADLVYLVKNAINGQQ